MSDANKFADAGMWPLNRLESAIIQLVHGAILRPGEFPDDLSDACHALIERGNADYAMRSQQYIDAEYALTWLNALWNLWENDPSGQYATEPRPGLLDLALATHRVEHARELLGVAVDAKMRRIILVQYAQQIVVAVRDAGRK